MRQKNISVQRCHQNGYCCLIILGSVGRAAMMFVATPIIMDSHITVTVGIIVNFRRWENFVTAKSTTKITKISTPRKLPAIWYYIPVMFQLCVSKTYDYQLYNNHHHHQLNWPCLWQHVPLPVGPEMVAVAYQHHPARGRMTCTAASG